jgi:hypothetical protein
MRNLKNSEQKKCSIQAQNQQDILPTILTIKHFQNRQMQIEEEEEEEEKQLITEAKEAWKHISILFWEKENSALAYCTKTKRFLSVHKERRCIPRQNLWAELKTAGSKSPLARVESCWSQSEAGVLFDFCARARTANTLEEYLIFRNKQNMPLLEPEILEILLLVKAQLNFVGNYGFCFSQLGLTDIEFLEEGSGFPVLVNFRNLRKLKKHEWPNN